MYFEFVEFYKRDVYFEYDDDRNSISQFDFIEGIKIALSQPLHYNVDKLDSYLKSYDLLPTFAAPLVSDRFRSLFESLENIELEFHKAIISDKKGNMESGFYALNILNKIACLDMQKSVTEITSYGTLRIEKLYITSNALGSRSIVRMEEKQSCIIVTEEFKKNCEKSKLKGIHFVQIG